MILLLRDLFFFANCEILIYYRRKRFCKINNLQKKVEKNQVLKEKGVF